MKYTTGKGRGKIDNRLTNLLADSWSDWMN